MLCLILGHDYMSFMCDLFVGWEAIKLKTIEYCHDFVQLYNAGITIWGRGVTHGMDVDSCIRIFLINFEELFILSS